MHHLSGRQLIALVGVLILVFLLAVLLAALPNGQMQNSQPASSQTLPTPTPPTAAQLQQLKSDPPSFQYLISYTGSGFAPSVLSVQRGETVRFVNNSPEQLWVASVGEGSSKIYPGSSNCGGSSFDSCGPLQPGEYWEFTFTQSGSYDFQNNLDTSKAGTITITVQ